MERSNPFHDYDLIEARKFESQTPFSHQNQALEKIKKWFVKERGSNAGGIVVLPTGGGKTFTAIRFLCSTVIGQGYKVLWLAHTHHLLDQAFMAFERSVATIPEPKPNLATRIVSGTPGHHPVHQIKPDDDVIVATLQTTTLAFKENHPELLAFLKKAGDRLCVVFDEAHHSPAPSYRKLLAAMRADHAEMILIGLTATPTYSDPRKAGWLKELFPQGIIHQSEAQALIADGILARPNFERIPTEITPNFDEREYLKWVDTYRDLPEDIIKSLAENQQRNALIAEHYCKNRERYGRTIIFAERWYQCEQIESFLTSRGVRAGSVFSKVDATPSTVAGRNARTADENHRTLEMFKVGGKDGGIDVLLNVRMLTEGTDVPKTQTVFLTRQTTSAILLTQMVGRALRGPRVDGTEEAYIVSFEDNWKQKINWAGFDQLGVGPKDETEIVYGKRPPVQLISIDLVRRLADQMDSGVNVAPMAFLKLMPIGWYSVEFQTLVAGTEDIETIRQLIMVFEDQEEGYRRFLEELTKVDLSKLSTEHATIADAESLIDGSIVRFFPDQVDEITRIVPKDLFHLARHVAQNDGEIPRFFPFGERTGYDLDAVANSNIDQSVGPRQVHDTLKTEYQRRDRFWMALYPRFELFETQYDACNRRILRGPAPIPPPDPPPPPPPPREPPEGLKAEAKSRDGWRCLCCGETNRHRLQVDHTMPRYLGGAHTLENLQTLCKECNREKGITCVNFRVHRDCSLAVAPVTFTSVCIPNQGHEGDPVRWEQSLRRAVNFFYRAAAVESITIGRKERHFYEWTLNLYEGNDPSWLKAFLPEILSKIRATRSKARLESPEGIRVNGHLHPETAYFIEVDPGAIQSEFLWLPNGTECRLIIDGQTHMGVLRGGLLRIARRNFNSFSAAFQHLAGRTTNNYWRAWEIRPPGSVEWVRGDEYRKDHPGADMIG